MKPLEKSLRNKLEKTVKEARDVAEKAATASLEQLGVAETSAFSYLSDDQRQLRRKLRAHGRQLGDTKNIITDLQQIDRLTEEVAYEHWHRMLFARFLAENDLLMYEGVAVTLEECEELAADEGAANGWELAGRLASKMLPQIFRPDSPVLQLILPPEHQQKLERLVADLPVETFTASDSLGWVYQFWQAKRKDEVNASEVKIGARELPAVTQLFTEPYMVAFLLDNSLGAWWAARRLSESDLRNATSEDELRDKAAIVGVPLEYLRFVKTEDGDAWTPAAGTFDGWAEHLSELKTLDPCCGSGHFLVAALLMLVPMRMELETLSAREAVDAVLRENLHGLELDQRCVELAAFALALTAWRYPNAGGYRPLPELNVACSGLAIGAKKEEWLALAGDNTNLRIALEELYKQFKDAPVLGSLINPQISLGKGSLFELQWEEVGPLLTKALSGEKDVERTEIGVVAQGVSKAADILSMNYEWVFTNVPYLGREKQVETLKDFCEEDYSVAKADLATVFILRCLELNSREGVSSVVVPQYWLFLSRYEKLRNQLLKNTSFSTIAKLGPGAFETITGEVVNVALVTTKNQSPEINTKFSFFNFVEKQGVAEKSEALKFDEFSEIVQKTQLSNPNTVIGHEGKSNHGLLELHSYSYQGLATSDNSRFLQTFWERNGFSKGWVPFQFAPQSNKDFGGLSHSLFWDKGKGEYYLHALELKKEKRLGGWKSGHEAWGKKGIAVNRMGNLLSVYYLGTHFDCNVAIIIPNDETHLTAIHSYCISDEFSTEVRKINQKLSVTNATLVKVPFDLDYWTKVAEEKYPNGLPKPYSDDPTQWIFHGHPARSDEPLQVAVARLLGYRFPAELDPEMELSDEARALVEQSKELLPFADEDGIVCLPPVRGESSAADRLLNLLAAAYGDDWSNDKLLQLLTNADHTGKTLETWLREKFFTQHCKVFQHRPFIWHIWDGLRDGFAALVNYHKLDYKNLETLIYTYLGDWITRQKQDIERGVDGAQEKLAAAEQLKKRLELILEGEKPYDIFVRWKPIEKQPIGWNPDLNDGVRMNIRPFMSVPDVGKRDAGVLRDKPNIKWDKDRGKDVESAPWFHLFVGDRINDHHLSLDEKKAAISSGN